MLGVSNPAALHLTKEDRKVAAATAFIKSCLEERRVIHGIGMLVGLTQCDLPGLGAIVLLPSGLCSNDCLVVRTCSVLKAKKRSYR
jgi:hypothetical protein